MIDVKTGIIKIDENLSFSPFFSYEDFKKTAYFNGQKDVELIHLGQHEISGYKFMVSFFFREKKICMIFLSNVDVEISFNDEKYRKEVHDQILAREGIKCGVYSWGTIESDYDLQCDVSDIIICYRKIEVNQMAQNMSRQNQKLSVLGEMLQKIFKGFR